jgi:PAS domain S-box-containing protein
MSAAKALARTFDELQSTLNVIDSNQVNLLTTASERVLIYRRRLRELEDALREKQAKRARAVALRVRNAPQLSFDVVFEHSSVAIVFCFDCRILSMNARFREIFQWEPATLLGKRMTLLKHPEDTLQACESLARQAAGEPPRAFPKKTLTRSGTYRAGSIMPLVIRGRAGQPLFYGAILFEEGEEDATASATQFFTRHVPTVTVNEKVLAEMPDPEELLLPSPPSPSSSRAAALSPTALWTSLLPDTFDSIID